MKKPVVAESEGVSSPSSAKGYVDVVFSTFLRSGGAQERAKGINGSRATVWKNMTADNTYSTTKMRRRRIALSMEVGR